MFEWRTADDRLVWANDSLYAIIGRPMQGKPLTMQELYTDVLVPEDAARLQQELQISLRSGNATTQQCRIRRLDNGEVRTVELSLLWQPGTDGAPMRAVGVLSDITEREQALKAERHLAAIVGSSDDAILSKDLNGIILSWNRGAERMFGYTAEETIGQPVIMLFPPGRENEEPTIVSRIRRGERIEHYETVRRRKDGSLFHVSLSVSPIKDEQGRIVGASKIARDITEQKRLADALQESNKHKDHFLATLAHELRNPLAPLKHGLDLVLAEPEDAALRERSHAMMARQLDHLVRLVDDLMDLSRINRGKIQLLQEHVTVEDVVRTAVEASRPLLDAQHHTLHVHVQPGLTLHGDPARLTQVLSNLLNNAAKYTPANGHVRLRAERMQGTVVIHVQDNGIGIAPQALPHVFDMFTQVASEERTRVSGGLGIGLNIVQRLVEMHGGRVEAESPGPGHGSLFTVYLPLAEGPVRTAVPAPPVEAGHHASRILVVDDNTDAAQLMGLLLRKLGHQVEVVHDGLSALKAGAAFLPNVVLMDIGMPGLNGYDTCRLMRGTSWGDGTRIIAVSGWGQAEDRRRSAEAGFDDHLVKPVDVQQLHKAFSAS